MYVEDLGGMQVKHLPRLPEVNQAMRYPNLLKNQAVELYAEGLSLVKISRQLNVSKSVVYRWVSPRAQALHEESRRRRRENPEYRERERAYNRAHRQAPERKERQNQLERDRRATDPAFRLMCRLRARTRNLLRGINKSTRTEELLGISALELVERWNVEYTLGWESNSNLHIDHIRPCASFDILSPAQQHVCFNYRNLQLLPASENQSKNNLWTPEMESAWTRRMRDLGWEGELFPVFEVDPC